MNNEIEKFRVLKTLPKYPSLQAVKTEIDDAELLQQYGPRDSIYSVICKKEKRIFL